MAISANCNKVIQPSFNFTSKLVQGYQMVGFSKAITQLSVIFLENQPADFACIVIPYFAFCRKIAAPFSLKMAYNLLSIFNLGIYLPIIIFTIVVFLKCFCHGFKKGNSRKDKSGFYAW